MRSDVVDCWFGAFHEKDVGMLKLADDFFHASPFGVGKRPRLYGERQTG